MLILIVSSLTEEQTNLIERIYKDDYGLFFSVAYNILQSKAAAEDSVHASFLKITEKIEKISCIPRPQLRAYCIIIVKREALGAIRSQKREVLTDEVCFFEDSGESNPEEVVERLLQKEEARACFQKLADDDKELLFLRLYKEMNYKQIASYYDITVESAKKRGQRALHRFRALFTNNK